MTAEPSVPFVVSVHRLRLAPEQRLDAVNAVWVEVDLLGLHAAECRTPRLKPSEAERAVQFQYALQITSDSPEAEKLRKALRSPDEQERISSYVILSCMYVCVPWWFSQWQPLVWHALSYLSQ